MIEVRLKYSTKEDLLPHLAVAVETELLSAKEALRVLVEESLRSVHVEHV